LAVALQGLSGLGGGVTLVADPTGASLGLPDDLLEHSPFRNYLIPGLILLVVLGVVPLIVSWGLWRRRRWSWYGSVFVGIALIVWIIVQIMLIGYGTDPPLQAIYGGLGVTILGLAFIRRVEAYLRAV
jgi:hypothetical protein